MPLIQDSVTVEGLTYTNAFGTQETVQPTSASTLPLTVNSPYTQTFTGTVAGQVVQLPNATTLLVGHRFEICNVSTQSIAINNNGSTLLATVQGGSSARIVLQDNSTINGVWIITIIGAGNTTSPMVIYFSGKAIKNSYIGGPVSSTTTSDVACPRFPRPIKVIGWAVDNGLLNTPPAYCNFNIRLEENSNLGVGLYTFACGQGRYNGGWYPAGYCTYTTGQGMSVYIGAGTDNKNVSPTLSIWFVWND